MHQPFLTHRCVVIAAPVQAWSAPDGQADGLAATRDVEGIYCGDTRVVSQGLLDAPGQRLEHVATAEQGGGTSSHQYVLRTPELGVDPAVLLTRERTATPSGVGERLVLSTASLHDLSIELRLRLRPDATSMQDIKQGAPASPVALAPGQTSFCWRDANTTARLHSDAELSVADGCWVLAWRLTLPARGTVEAGWQLDLDDAAAPFVACTAAPLQPPAATGNPALDGLLRTSFADINGLRLARRERPDEGFLAAGAPWYFTLFGRDSLIAAMNLLPHDLGVAAGTLCVLAGLQGTEVDVESAQQPGKILHEVRQEPLELHVSHQQTASDEPRPTVLPPLYYGTIDATPLWILLFSRAEQAGLDQATVRRLLPALEAALGWLQHHFDADGDSFGEYVDASGHGLANQGWKDSGDSVRFADGSLATGSVALCEVQGYAHAALLAGVRLLETYRGPDASHDALRAQANRLASRFREAFWTSDELGPYPVLALADEHGDGGKVQVDGVASNMGHLLGTGILNHDEECAVVARLVHPSMDSGYGIRTMSTTNGGYWPMSYHVGSVWTHDTAFTIDAMLRSGFRDEAARLARGLLRAADGFGQRMPELFGGQAASEVFPPQPYPASCHPQAWAATSSVVIARAMA